MDSYLMDAATLWHTDLRMEAAKAYVAGKDFQVITEGRVQTLIIGDRAGQAAGGDAVWGDWDAEDEVLRTDGEGKAYGLDGKEVPNGRP